MPGAAGDPGLDARDRRLTAEVLRAGGLVAFPTETVYGLGADATSDAVGMRGEPGPAARPLSGRAQKTASGR